MYANEIYLKFKMRIRAVDRLTAHLHHIS